MSQTQVGPCQLGQSQSSPYVCSTGGSESTVCVERSVDDELGVSTSVLEVETTRE